MIAIQCKYTCALCGVHRQVVTVRQRGEAEDLMDWMDYLTHKLMEDHSMRSPNCHPTVFDEVMIPSADNCPLGREPKDFTKK